MRRPGDRRETPSARRRLLFAGAAVLFLADLAWIGGHGPVGRGGYPLVAAYFAAHGLMAALWRVWPFRRGGAAAILLLAAAARLLLFPFPPGDDLNRYIWEGKIQNQGFNPYALAPEAPELAHLRDANWKGINHKDMSAIYPPLAQLLFRGLAAASEDPKCFKLAFALLDLGTVLVLLALAGSYGMEARHVLLYALNPLVLLYTTGEAHLDILYVFFLALAFLAWRSGRQGAAFLSLGLSVTAKVIPLLFVPLFLRRENLRKAGFFLLPFLLVLPYMDGLPGLAGVMGRYTGTFYYNAALFSVLQPFMENAPAIRCCWIALAAIAAGVFFLVPDPHRGAYLLAGAFVFCAPCMHPWYLLLVAFFLPFFRSSPWLLLLACAGATFPTRIFQYETGGWIDYPLARCIEYLPLAALLLRGAWKGRTTGPRAFPPPERLSVVIPVLNEAEGIEACLRSLLEGAPEDLEVIVVDGGSTDGTPEKVARFPGIALVEASGGRGGQVAAGTAHAHGDAVLVLHADSRLEQGVPARILDALARTPCAAGGALGSRYEDPSPRYRFIAFLDNLRAGLFGISFGNQGQFFRKAYLRGGVPPFRLMEDVELAFRMKESGGVILLRRGIVNRTRRWRRVGYLQNALLVLRLTGSFVVRRRLGLLRGDLEGFYRRYYG